MLESEARCPYCAEEIKPGALKCKHCKSDLKPAANPAILALQKTITALSKFGTIATALLTLPILGLIFFGWLELTNYPDMPGYELVTYIGIVLGVLTATPLGVIMALKIAGRGNKIEVK